MAPEGIICGASSFPSVWDHSILFVPEVMLYLPILGPYFPSWGMKCPNCYSHTTHSTTNRLNAFFYYPNISQKLTLAGRINILMTGVVRNHCRWNKTHLWLNTRHVCLKTKNGGVFLPKSIINVVDILLGLSWSVAGNLRIPLHVFR